MALDQSYRYVNLDLDEDQLIKLGRHVLVAYIMRPKTGFDFLATAAHFAAESSTGTNVEVCTTDDHTRSVDALVYHADKKTGLVKIAFPIDLFDRNIIDGKAMVASFLTLCIGNNQGMGDVEYGKMHDFYFPPEYLKLYDGPATTLSHFWKILGRREQHGGLIVGTIIKPKLGLRPEPFAKAAYDFWLGGDFIKNDEPQGNQPFAPLKETITLTSGSLRRAQDKTGEAKLFSANITADDHDEMLARGEFILDAFKENADHVAFLVDGYVAGPSAVTNGPQKFSKHLYPLSSGRPRSGHLCAK
ncbi:Ribulose bisphosphate carboxylase [gamma proteobacterium IMCC2047]|nr:Ribulose bisphosphate carboxylase [gamma proteobacterium IMCC2047]